MNKTPKFHGPSPTQREALEKMAAGGGVLHRWPGGYWRVVAYNDPDGMRRADYSWSTGTTTAVALERRGWVERVGLFADAWKDSLKLTAAGRAVLGLQAAGAGVGAKETSC